MAGWQLTIGRRLGLLTFVLALAIGTVAAVGAGALHRQARATADFIDGDFALRHTVGELQLSLAQARRHEKDLMLWMSDERAVARSLAAWKAQMARARERVAEFARRVEGSELQEPAALLDASVGRYASAFERVAGRVQEQAFDSATAASRLLDRVEEDFAAAQKVLLGANAALERRSQALRARLGTEQAAALAVVGAVAAAAVLSALLLGWRTARQIVQRLRAAAETARAVAAGDLAHAGTTDAALAGRDELGELLRALAGMTAQLRQAIGDVRDAAIEITGASEQVAAGSGDLATRTEEQGASLQQTAAGMAQITTTVRNNADAASRAAEFARSASEVATRGGRVVEQVVGTMAEIDDSARRIGEIIGVIDGLAFRTNILALNAAVEAARAGESGRGFAVVAAEVRALAQGSATAAREIRTLIDTSTQRVESGSRLVRDAGQTMSELLAGVRHVSELIAGISAATGEQSAEIAQVGDAMAQLDRMTQQNAALVQQSAAAAQSLQAQAGRLAGAVRVFRVD